jgi:hypothetical protein
MAVNPKYETSYDSSTVIYDCESLRLESGVNTIAIPVVSCVVVFPVSGSSLARFSLLKLTFLLDVIFASLPLRQSDWHAKSNNDSQQERYKYEGNGQQSWESSANKSEQLFHGTNAGCTA